MLYNLEPMKPHFPKPLWIQNVNTPCPCGSKLIYRKCCKPHFGIRERYYSFVQGGDLINAERAIRAKLCEYVGWVLCHTIFLSNGAASRGNDQDRHQCP